ncbi:MAG: glutamine--tRNA ligase/YqeY domain fusion protein [Deltaproteobacteria bacterium]|nr:glutamine--tRNA ligase/YqeY domain fusion protein [Deltaproteobacteria bacterium]
MTGPEPAAPAAEPAAPGNFIREIIEEDRRTGMHGGRVATRFPPEPNGYLHIGHAKSICLNFGLAQSYGGVCHLRFDDTNPTTEDSEYVDAIQRDVRWLGFDWGERLFFASDYFELLYQFAVRLIEAGEAYVCELAEDQIREYRGTVTAPGRPSPFRDRPVQESLDLFRRMRAGELRDGACVLRAKIDMAAANMKMRDPLLYRIRHAAHYRQGERWCIYPLYDFTHCLSDAIEGITHSICTLEFENNRELYDWVLDRARAPCHPQQIEFARLELSYTLMSKRKLAELVETRVVSGWDDPRMPTIAGMRRRGYTPEAIRRFCELIGVAKTNSLVDLGKLEFCVRDDLNRRAPRVMCVLRPLRLVVENWPEGRVETIDAPYFPSGTEPEADPAGTREAAKLGPAGSRPVPFARVLYIERDDFCEHPPEKYFRLAPGREVRLRHGYVVKCTGFTKDERSGEVEEIRCVYDPDSKGARRRVPGTLHWVSAEHAAQVEVRLYDRLFTTEVPGQGGDYKLDVNPRSLEVLRAQAEPSLAGAGPGTYQFERQGYFAVDLRDSAPGVPVFNRTVTLRDSWAKLVARAAQQQRPADEPAAPPAEARAPEHSGAAKARPPKAAPAASAKRRSEVRDGGGGLARAQELDLVAEQVIAGHPEPVARYRAGKTGVLGFLVGELVRATRGRADPRGAAELLRRKLG